MNANILQDFQAMQIAFLGANYMRYGRGAECLSLEGIDKISIGDTIEITEISLNTDYVLVSIGDIHSFMPIKNLAYSVMVEVIATLKAKALELAGRDVMVNGNGEIVL